MSASDILKAALEKKKQQQHLSSGKKANDGAKGIHGNQVAVNKPQKKTTGRGR